MIARSTIRDVASEAGVSLATVSVALNGKPGVSAETRQRVQAVAERLGYRQRVKPRTIGLLIERLHVPAYSDPGVGVTIQGVETEASLRGYHLLLASLEPGASVLPAMVLERQVSGLIVLGGGDISDQYIRTLLAADLPIVLADNFVTGLAVSCILGTNALGAYEATRHLIELGHQRIAILEGPRKYKTLTERLEGYLRAMDEAGYPPDPLLMVKPLHSGPRKGYQEAQSLLALPRAQWPTAIFSVSDKTALGALEALKDAGLRVPEDIALVGFDDIAESAHVLPALTTVRYPLQALGRVAFNRLAELIDGVNTLPCLTVLYTELVVRQSSGAKRDIAREAETVHALR